ncbi:MAG: hypothetical protein R3B45_02690 [Bdellovibrionota bacterium]
MKGLLMVFMKQNIFKILITVFFVISPLEVVLGAVHFTLKGSASDSNFFLQTQSMSSLSGSVSMDLGSYFQLGLTYRQDVSSQKGYSQVEGEEDKYYYSNNTTLLKAYSADFILILYYGEVFVPYLITGIIAKEYYLESVGPDGESVVTKTPTMPSWNAGIGVSLPINRTFSLKLSWTVSPGYKQKSPNAELTKTIDHFRSVGISYKL